MIIDTYNKSVHISGYDKPIPLCEKVPEGFRKIKILGRSFNGCDFYYKSYGNRLIAVLTTFIKDDEEKSKNIIDNEMI